MYARRPVARRRRLAKKRSRPYAKKTRVGRRIPRSITTNTAAVKETYSFQAVDGNMTYIRNIQLADAIYDRSQTVASAFQEFRIKYVKLTFRPSADTFPAVAGNTIPQLYFMKDLANAIPTNATADTMFSMGCRPRRMDDKNLVYAWKPSTLTSDIVGPGVNTASQIKISPWLSTNANSGNPVPAWAPSTVDHLGCVFYVTKINPADALQYNVDVEVVFQFRKPVWKGSSESVNNFQLINGEVKPLSVSA